MFTQTERLAKQDSEMAALEEEFIKKMTMKAKLKAEKQKQKEEEWELTNKSPQFVIPEVVPEPNPPVEGTELEDWARSLHTQSVQRMLSKGDASTAVGYLHSTVTFTPPKFEPATSYRPPCYKCKGKERCNTVYVLSTKLIVCSECYVPTSTSTAFIKAIETYTPLFQ